MSRCSMFCSSSSAALGSNEARREQPRSADVHGQARRLVTSFVLVPGCLLHLRFSRQVYLATHVAPRTEHHEHEHATISPDSLSAYGRSSSLNPLATDHSLDSSKERSPTSPSCHSALSSRLSKRSRPRSLLAMSPTLDQLPALPPEHLRLSPAHPVTPPSGHTPMRSIQA